MGEISWIVYLSDPSRTLADSLLEEDWLACDDPLALQLFIPRCQVSGRKARLFACACSRRLWALLGDDRSRAAVEIAEHFADGKATGEQLAQARQDALEAAQSVQGQPAWHAAICAVLAAAEVEQLADGQNAHGVAQAAAASLANATGLDSMNEDEEEAWNQAAQVAGRELMLVFQDIIGNPFRPFTVDPAWLTPTVVSLAQGIYDERAFDRLPILADALEDAGCTSREMLDHCRQPGEHVLGCWALDLVLRKE